MTDVLSVLNPIAVVPASGASLTLNPPVGIDPVFDVTLTADCMIMLPTGLSTARRHVFELKLRQAATGGRKAILGNANWSNGSAPQLVTKASAFDVLQFATTDGGAHWEGAIVAFNTLYATKPGAPTLTAIAGNTNITVTWVDGATNNGPTLQRKLYLGTASGAETFNANLTLDANNQVVITGLTNGQAYFLYGVQVNAAGASDASAEKSAIPVNARTLVLPGKDAQGNTATGISATTANASKAVTNYVDMMIDMTTTAFPGAAAYILDNNNRMFVYNPSANVLALVYFANAETSAQFVTAFAALPAAAFGVPAIYRVTANTDASASFTVAGVTTGPHSANLYYSLDGGATWVYVDGKQLGSTKQFTSGSTTWKGPVNSFTANVRSIKVLDSAGAIVVNPVFSAQAAGATAFKGTSGEDWAVGAPAVIA